MYTPLRMYDRENKEIQPRMGFRRATHDRQGNYLKKFDDKSSASLRQRKSWELCGNIIHSMNSRRAMSFAEICQDVVADTTNYVSPLLGQEGPLDDRTPLPSPAEIAFAIVLGIEEGLIEVCQYDPVVEESPVGEEVEKK